MFKIIDLTVSEDSLKPDKDSIEKMGRTKKEPSSPAIKKVKVSPKQKALQSIPKKVASPKSTSKEQPHLKSIPSTDETDYTNFSSLLTSQMVTFHIGPKKKAYHIHRDLICSSSPIFSAHFGTLDTKSPVTEMYLPNHDPRVFELLISFLYRKQFPEIVPPASSSSSPSNNNPTTTTSTTTTTPTKDPTQQTIHTANLTLLLSLHFLAQDYSLPALQNHTLDHICLYLQKSYTLLQVSHLNSIYSRLPDAKAPLRRFAVDHFVWSVMKKSVSGKVRRECLRKAARVEPAQGEVVGEFVLDVVDAVVGGRKYPCPVEPGKGVEGRCGYHVHGKGEKCGE